MKNQKNNENVVNINVNHQQNHMHMINLISVNPVKNSIVSPTTMKRF